MTASELRNEIQRFVGLLFQHELAVAHNPVVIEEGARHMRTVTWRPPATTGDVKEAAEFCTVAEYRWLIRNAHYTCLLRDGGLLQMTFSLLRETPVRHRLCYYPCPVVINEEDFELTEDVGELFDYLLEQDAKAFLLPEGTETARLRLRSPIRFEFEPTQESADHPATHLHTHHNDCRWAVFGPLSLGHFVRFVFKNFYPDAWAKNEFLRTWRLEWGGRSIRLEQEEGLYVDSRQRGLAARLKRALR